LTSSRARPASTSPRTSPCDNFIFLHHVVVVVMVDRADVPRFAVAVSAVSQSSSSRAAPPSSFANAYGGSSFAFTTVIEPPPFADPPSPASRRPHRQVQQILRVHVLQRAERVKGESEGDPDYCHVVNTFMSKRDLPATFVDWKDDGVGETEHYAREYDKLPNTRLRPRFACTWKDASHSQGCRALVASHGYRWK
jgi:hypothetical protein